MTQSQNPSYRSFAAARNRCNSPSNPNYHYYGGRGIRFLWPNFRAFITDMGLRPTSSHSIDRIDVNGDYCASNCRWATHDTQMLNRRRWVCRVTPTSHIFPYNSGKGWSVRIRLLFKGPQQHIGHTETFQEAQELRDLAIYEREFHAALGLTYVKPR